MLPTQDQIEFYFVQASKWTFITLSQCFFYFTCIACLLLSNTTIAQIDSLKQRLANAIENEEKVDILNALSYTYHQNELSKTLLLGQEAYDLAIKLNYSKGKAEALHCLSIGNSISGKAELAKEQNREAIQIAKEIKANGLLILAYNVLALIHDKSGNPDKAIEIYLLGLELARKEKDESGISVITSNIGGIYASTKDYDKAMAYYNLSVAAGERLKDNGSISWGCQKIGNIYLELKDYSNATEYYNKALLLASKIDDKRAMSLIKSSLSKIYVETGKKELAEQYAIEGVNLIKETGFIQNYVKSYTNLMEVYLKIGKPDKAIAIGKEVWHLQKSQPNYYNSTTIKELLAKAYAEKGEYQIAYELNLEHQIGKDSSNLESRINLALELEEKYQSEKKDAENALLKAEQQKQSVIIENQKLYNWFLFVITILSILLGFSFYRAYTTKKRMNNVLELKVKERTKALFTSNQQLKVSNEELASFAYVTSHDMREPLLNIMSFIKMLQAEMDNKNSSKKTLRFLMDTIVQNTRRMNKLIEDTLEFTNLSTIKLNKEPIELNDLIKNIESTIKPTLVKKQAIIEISKALPTVKATESHMHSLFKNLIENGIHYNENPFPKITIDYEMDPQFYTFSISDNGIGIPEEFHGTIFDMFKRLQNREKQEGTGLGLANCKKIVKHHGGEIWVESDQGKGATFYFTMGRN